MDQGYGIFHGPAIPVGLQYNVSLKTLSSLAKYKNATGAIVNSWRDQGWFNNMFEVATHDTATGTFVFATTATGATKGGFQGGRGYRINNTKGVPHGETLDCNGGWFIENVFEELDSPGEWWYDEVTRKLYVYPNTTSPEAGATLGAGSPPSPSLEFVVPQLSELLGVRGSQQQPARNITVRGLGFRDARYTYMDPRAYMPLMSPLAPPACLRVIACPLSTYSCSQHTQLTRRLAFDLRNDPWSFKTACPREVTGR